MKIGTPGHSVSISFALHSQCSVLKQAKALPYLCEPRLFQYLAAGLTITDRSHGARHKSMP